MHNCAARFKDDLISVCNGIVNIKTNKTFDLCMFIELTIAYCC
jgi:hypothetical protein